MKKIFLYTLILLLGSSCLDSYQDINTNLLYPNDEQKGTDGVAAGAYFVTFEKRIIPTRSAEGEGTDLPNRYQVAINLAGDNWAGYMSPMNNKWDLGLNFTTYYMKEGWVNYAYSTFFTNIINPWQQIREQTHIRKVEGGTVEYQKKALSDQAVFSVAQIIKVMGMHRATDTFGPMPYSKIGTGTLMIPYDSQESIYKSFFTELQVAVETLGEYLSKGGARIPALEDFDPIYKGDVTKWMKLGNSLMLRLAMRVRYVDADLSREWANKAVTNTSGLIENVDDIAKLESSDAHPFLNSLELLWKSYDDCRMGATIYCYLKGYDDPRQNAYFAKFEKDPEEFRLKAVRTGIPMAEVPDFYKNYSIPNVYNKTPVYWMKASEIYFLKAEAALFNIIVGSAQQFYEDGIRMSFKENNVELGSYLSRNNTPSAYEDPKKSEYNASAPSTVSVRWGGGSEEQLEKIITQKYLAIFPDGQEAWTEWRRTGYPKQITAYTNRTDGTHGNVIDSDGYKYGVRRMPFPRSEYDGINNENVLKAKLLLKSQVDDSNSRVWWDANSKLD